jgi:hypothetical protein
MFDIFYTAFITVIVMLLLHHLYNYLQSNLTVPKVHEISSTALHDLQEIQSQPKNQNDKEKDELKEYLNQFKKK